MCKSEVKAAMTKIVDSTAAQTSFQDSQSYVTFLFSERHIVATEIDDVLVKIFQTAIS